MDTETVVETETRSALRPSLSPSRAGDFQTCPLLYRFRVIDRLPEPADPVMVRGTLVHAVLEELFAEESAGRTLERAAALLPQEWSRLRDADPRLVELFPADSAAEEAAWLASGVELLRTYFTLEDPRWVEPAVREERVAYDHPSGLTLAGIVDRVDVAPDGRIRVVDYKSGGAPDPRFEDRALFQMKFYALVIWRTRGVVPTLLQLMYLRDGSVLTYQPEERELVATERKVVALWESISRSFEVGEFQPRRSASCRWCAHQALCPEWGGTPPPMPRVVDVEVSRERP